jgi:hypothetical protein
MLAVPWLLFQVKAQFDEIVTNRSNMVGCCGDGFVLIAWRSESVTSNLSTPPLNQEIISRSDIFIHIIKTVCQNVGSRS